jgi:hypothetical protein
MFYRIKKTSHFSHNYVLEFKVSPQMWFYIHKNIKLTTNTGQCLSFRWFKSTSNVMCELIKIYAHTHVHTHTHHTQMYVCMYIHAHTHMHAHVHNTYTHTSTYISTRMRTYTHTYMFTDQVQNTFTYALLVDWVQNLFWYIFCAAVINLPSPK